MTWQIVKIIITALLIWAISEISKRMSLVGAVLASVPLVSVVSFVWIYIETGNAKTIIDLSHSIFWLVIPSLVLFIVLPVLLKNKVNFYAALLLAIGATSASYYLVICVLRWCGTRL